MQIKSFIVMAGTIAWLFMTGPVLAQDTPAATAEPSAEDSPSAMPDPEAAPSMEKSEVRVRNTRPKVERHRDARACLDAGDNSAIIKCANKYR